MRGCFPLLPWLPSLCKCFSLCPCVPPRRGYFALSSRLPPLCRYFSCVHVYHSCMDISNDSHYWHLCYFWSHIGPSWNPFGGLPEQIINDLGSHSEPSRATILCWKQFGATNIIHEKALEGKWEDIRLGKRCKGKTR